MVIMASDGLWDVLSDQQAVDAAEVHPLGHAPCHHNMSAHSSRRLVKRLGQSVRCCLVSCVQLV